MELRVYGPLRAATGEKTVDIEVDGETVHDVIDAFVTEFPRTASQLVDEDGNIRPSVRVMVEDERATLGQAVSNEQSVKLFPAMRGG
ncbi:ubiquitin-like small modifier protein 1 [Haloferax sp. YSSS75]|uniref:ubiquitin-like small modifier protein 1 n=1 Tax=Haloferax sp. YSSS75 TaxID=3388564 RepID=UPI00398CEBA4